MVFLRQSASLTLVSTFVSNVPALSLNRCCLHVAGNGASLSAKSSHCVFLLWLFKIFVSFLFVVIRHIIQSFLSATVWTLLSVEGTEIWGTRCMPCKKIKKIKKGESPISSLDFANWGALSASDDPPMCLPDHWILLSPRVLSWRGNVSCVYYSTRMVSLPIMPISFDGLWFKTILVNFGPSS
jgi:hypothetical protein